MMRYVSTRDIYATPTDDTQCKCRVFNIILHIYNIGLVKRILNSEIMYFNYTKNKHFKAALLLLILNDDTDYAWGMFCKVQFIRAVRRFFTDNIFGQLVYPPPPPITNCAFFVARSLQKVYHNNL